jgi:hypothetical protein
VARAHRAALAAACGAGLAWPGSAAAHGSEDHSQHADKPAPSHADVTATYGGFHLGDAQGSYAVLSPSGEVAFARRLAAGSSLPLVALQVDGHEHAVGLGDLALHVRAVVVERRDLWFAGAVAVGLPTGDEDRGLGSGHVMLMPMALVGLGGRALWLQTMVGASLAVDADDQAHSQSHGGNHALPYRSMIAPHSMHELTYEAGLTLANEEPVSASLGLGGSTVLDEDGRGDTPLWISPKLMFRLSRDVRLTVGGQLPITEPRRFDGRFVVGSRVSF